MRHTLYLSLFIMGVLVNFSFAASFDCTKARTSQEGMVCADKTLSGLDEKLNRIYMSLKAQTVESGAIKRKQREWVKNVRDKCNSPSCLKDAYQQRIDELNGRAVEISRQKSICPITERSLIAGWKRTSGEGFFEEMAFEYEGKKRVFSSWLHQRPEIINGSWKFENCTIFINHSTSKELSFALKVDEYHKGRISLYDVTEKYYAVYKRIRLY